MASRRILFDDEDEEGEDYNPTANTNAETTNTNAAASET
jgi:hypothetical protein